MNEIYQPGNQADTEQANQRQFDNFGFGVFHKCALQFSCSTTLDVKAVEKLHYCGQNCHI